jgi:hypothetical protein
MFLTDLITQAGFRALTEFTICAAPLYDGLKRIEGNDGLALSCTRDHDGGGSWQKKWPGHVAAPSLRDLAVVAQQHWLGEHQAEQSATVKAEAAP